MSELKASTSATYALTLAYRGGAYAGWQRQENALAVQQVLEEALAELLGQAVRTVGSGRTDRGVHARAQVVSLSLPESRPLAALVHGTNRFLPHDIRVMAVRRAVPGFNARRDAESKEYRYSLRATEVLSPLESWHTVRVRPDLDFARIEQATRRLVGRHDFSAFAKTGGSHRDPHRRLFAAGWSVEEETRWTLSVHGEGFLRGMVRAIVGTLLDIGEGRRTIADLERLLLGGERGDAGANAPARGLTLHQVSYPTSCFLEV